MSLQIKLYQLDGCPYCKRVRDTLETKGLDYESVWVYAGNDDEDREMLTSISGQRFVPVLDYDGKIITESEKIVEFLNERH